jgi:hypothetical protein
VGKNYTGDGHKYVERFGGGVFFLFLLILPYVLVAELSKWLCRTLVQCILLEKNSPKTQMIPQYTKQLFTDSQKGKETWHNLRRKNMRKRKQSKKKKIRK